MDVFETPPWPVIGRLLFLRLPPDLWLVAVFGWCFWDASLIYDWLLYLQEKMQWRRRPRSRWVNSRRMNTSMWMTPRKHWKTSLREKVCVVQGWGQIRFIKYKYKYKYNFSRSFKYKYKYKYTGENLIKYKYKYKYSPSNTNTNTNTHWGRDKIAAILQMTYSNSLYCKIVSNFTENCFQRSNLPQASIGSDNGLALSRQQAIIWPMMAQFTDA